MKSKMKKSNGKAKKPTRHIREKPRKDSALLCGGGRALDPASLESVPVNKYKPNPNDCGRCVRSVKNLMG
jgi:hypothetical protein